jgi:hypothetical protein
MHPAPRELEHDRQRPTVTEAVNGRDLSLGRAGLALAFLIFGWAFVGFWRGLSLKPTDPQTRPKGWDTMWWHRQ